MAVCRHVTMNVKGLSSNVFEKKDFEIVNSVVNYICH